jgi:hypothetical protein
MTLQTNHSFIIRIMVEPASKPESAKEWKGMIQYVASGERKYFRNIDDIPELIRRILRPALEEDRDGSSPGKRRNPAHNG